METVLETQSAFALLSGTIGTLHPDGLISAESGHPYTVTTPANVVTDSHLRYFSATWTGFGGLLWWASNDLAARRTPLQIVLGAIMFGGFGRLVSGARHGMQAAPLFLRVVTAGEILGPVGVWMMLP